MINDCTVSELFPPPPQPENRTATQQTTRLEARCLHLALLGVTIKLNPGGPSCHTLKTISRPLSIRIAVPESPAPRSLSNGRRHSVIDLEFTYHNTVAMQHWRSKAGERCDHWSHQHANRSLRRRAASTRISQAATVTLAESTKIKQKRGSMRVFEAKKYTCHTADMRVRSTSRETWEAMRRIVSAWAFVVLGTLTACGGGSSAPPPLPPTISNLSYSPSVADYQSGGGAITITGTISFNDPAGQLASIMITTSGGGNVTIPATGASGHTSGSLTGSFQVSTNTAGHFTFDVWVVDTNGSTSNHLSGSFDVVSIPGTAWTQSSSATTADLRRVASSGSQFVAVGAGGTIVSSSDGASWSIDTSGTSNSLWGVTWTGKRFVAVGDQGTVLVSSDGVTWSTLNTGRADITLLAVAESQTELVVVGGQGAGSGANPGSLSSLIMSTADDMTWTERPTSMNNWAFYGVAWSGTTFVAVGQSFVGVPNNDVIWTSSDGINWSSQTVMTHQYALYDLIWTGSDFIAVGHGYGLLSADGVTWQAFGSQIAGANNSFGLYASGVASSGGNYLAVGDAFGQIETSLDGLAWSEAQPAPGLGTLFGATGTNTEFVAVGKGGAIFTSNH
jgi:hypothetical protein